MTISPTTRVVRPGRPGRPLRIEDIQAVPRPGAPVPHPDGTTLVSRAVMSSWSWIYARSARLVGGCRPTRAAEVLEARGWKLRHHQVVVAWGVASEVVVASPPSASRA